MHSFNEDMANVTPFADLEIIARKMVLAAAEYLEDSPGLDIEYRGVAGELGLKRGKPYRPTTDGASLLSRYVRQQITDLDLRIQHTRASAIVGTTLPVPPREEVIEAAHHFAAPHFVDIADLGWTEYVKKSEATKKQQQRRRAA
jgi:hypothetical protein